MASPSTEIGALIAGKYRLLARLGEGGMGVVFLALHVTLGSKVAVKVLAAQGRTGADEKRFLLEAQAAAQLRSAHIARVTDFGTLEDGRQFMVMEHLEGEDLGTLLARRRSLHPQEAADFVIQACAGLAEAHAIGVVHRDIKPSNLFVTHANDGSPLLKLLDFGVSKFSTEIGGPVSAITSKGLAVGTPLYMSPEQIKAQRVDSRADIWALGVVLYELCTGVSPFFDESLGVLLLNILERPHAPMSTHVPAIDESLASVIDDCLEKAAAARPDCVATLAERLAPFATIEGRRIADRVRAVSQRAASREHLSLTPSSSSQRPPGQAIVASAHPTDGAANVELPTVPVPVVSPPSGDVRGASTPQPVQSTTSLPVSRAAPVAIFAGVGLAIAAVIAIAAISREDSAPHGASAAFPELSTSAAAVPVAATQTGNVVIAPEPPASASAMTAESTASSHTVSSASPSATVSPARTSKASPSARATVTASAAQPAASASAPKRTLH
ncbi:MAG: protein kinase [Polyangiaceae bacterium]|nr:protein kinase [Polyangiaceae bacterium]